MKRFLAQVHTNTKWQTRKFLNLTAYLFPHLKKKIVTVRPQVAGNTIIRVTLSEGPFLLYWKYKPQ